MVDCRDLCSCLDPSRCDKVCRHHVPRFVARMREVGGLDFGNLQRVASRGIPKLPLVFPLVDHRSARQSKLDEPVIALSLYEVVNMATGKVHVATRDELSARFRISPEATIVLSGIDKDRPIENWWGFKNRQDLLATLANLRIGLITAPNYSIFTDVPRTDNLHAMKRIGIAWAEMAAAGLPAALHINARTEHDYGRWATLIGERSEIEIIAFEFATGSGFGERIKWHVDQLCQLADRVKRPLAIIIRGGGRVIPVLRRHFAQVSLIETDSFFKTHRRRKASLTESGRLKWSAHFTEKGAPLDELFSHNVAVVKRHYEMGGGSALAPRLQPVVRAAHRNDQATQRGFLRNLDLPGEAGRVAPDPKNMVIATKA